MLESNVKKANVSHMTIQNVLERISIVFSTKE